MKILIIPNMTREKTPEVTRAVIAELKSLGLEYCMGTELEGDFSDSDGIQYLPVDDAAKICDIIIAVGGDGSLIYAAKYAARHNTPLLGVNAGGLAFMAGLEGYETELLSSLISGNYKVDKRMMLWASVRNAENEEVYSSYCVNDVAIMRGANMHQLALSLSKNGEKLNDYNADGLIIATPTGSTAYSLSAGGPVIEPTVQSIVVTPICNHTMMTRSIVLREDSRLCVTIPFIGSGAVLSCDSQESVTLTEGCRIYVEKASETCDLIRIKGSSFIDVLKDKFNNRLI